MKQIYFDRASRSIADLVELDPAYYLVTRINVPRESRNRGLGTKILTEILSDADMEGVTLEIHPMSSGGLSRAQLITWYKRHGFRWEQDYYSHDPVKVLVRKPGGNAFHE